jgi:hypothetical protein
MGSDSRMSRGANMLACLLLSLLLMTGFVPASAPLRTMSARSLEEYRATSPGARASVQQPVDVINARRGLADLAPKRLIIPKLHLDAPILAVGADASGAMLAPRVGGPGDPIWNSVYWWDVGVTPGQLGNAVIAGHVNKPDGSPSTFTRLAALAPGDKIEVVTESGRVLTFTVRAKNAPLVYVRKTNDPTMGRIFGPALTSNLNLMTCWGEWDGKEYNRRLVIYSTLDGPSPFPIPEGLANFAGR